MVGGWVVGRAYVLGLETGPGAFVFVKVPAVRVKKLFGVCLAFF